MKKVLFTATVDSHILAFHIPYLKYFKEQGYEVHVATNGNEKIPYCDKKIVVSFERSPFKINNIKAIFKLKKIVNKEKYDLIHCHTPMGSVVTRLAAIYTRKHNGTRVLYTAHGFHFYKGASMINWLLFYPVEKFLAKFTDTLITINKEDYNLAKSKFKTNVEYVKGVGIDPNKFDVKINELEKANLRESLNLKSDDFVMLYPAELSSRKNQEWLIKTLKPLIDSDNSIKLLLPGKDSLNGLHQKLIKELNLSNNIFLLGFRTDIPKLLRISNLALSSSKQEGLPVNIMEAMYVGISIVATNCRGNKDLIMNEKNSFLIEQNDSKKFCEAIEILKNSNVKYVSKIIENYMLDKVLSEMNKVYESR